MSQMHKVSRQIMLLNSSQNNTVIAVRIVGLNTALENPTEKSIKKVCKNIQ